VIAETARWGGNVTLPRKQREFHRNDFRSERRRVRRSRAISRWRRRSFRGNSLRFRNGIYYTSSAESGEACCQCVRVRRVILEEL